MGAKLSKCRREQRLREKFHSDTPELVSQINVRKRGLSSLDCHYLLASCLLATPWLLRVAVNRQDVSVLIPKPVI